MAFVNSDTVLVTGGAGFIGSHLVDHLLARRERVIVLDNLNDYYNPAQKRANIVEHLKNPNYTLIEGDLRDAVCVNRLFEEYRPARVAHLAAMAGVRYSIERASLYTDVNVQGTINMLEAARKHGVENFINASTSSVYGATEHTPFTEDQPCDQPLAPYPATKRAAEMLAYAFHNMFGMNITSVRFFTVYGPRVRPDMMAFMVMDAIVKDKEVVVYNNGELYRDWTFVDDIIQGVVAALDKPLGSEVINIGRGEPVRLADFVEIIEELTGKEARIKHLPAPASEPPITFASVDKARRLLGYQPHTSVPQGLKHTWDWYREFHNL